MSLIIKLLLSRLWPVFLPIIFYFLWFLICKYVLKRDVKIGDGYFRPTIFLSAALLFICLVIMFFNTKNEHYVPTKIIDGKLVPSHVEEN